MFCLGLTGSIGMGKSTTAGLFEVEGCAVWDADAAVHRAYAPDGSAIAPLSEIVPQAIDKNGLSREKLREIIATDPTLLKRIEAVVHPLVARDRAEFIKSTKSHIGVFDIPLLFETGGDQEMDAVACVSVSPEIQAERVMARGTMTRADFDRILSKQMPNDEKCARSDFVITTDTIEQAREQVQNVVRTIKGSLIHA